MCGTPEACRNSGRGVELRIKTTERDGICSHHKSVLNQLPIIRRRKMTSSLTISPNLASADNSVGGASRCLSIPSKTKTNFPIACPGLETRHSPSRTAREPTCSHLPFPNRSHSSFRPRASRMVHNIFVNKCRPVMHSGLRTMACGTSSRARTLLTIVDLQVADIPWTTIVDGLDTPD